VDKFGERIFDGQAFDPLAVVQVFTAPADYQFTAPMTIFGEDLATAGNTRPGARLCCLAVAMTLLVLRKLPRG
jgi:hypothetical protein